MAMLANALVIIHLLYILFVVVKKQPSLQAACLLRLANLVLYRPACEHSLGGGTAPGAGAAEMAQGFVTVAPRVELFYQEKGKGLALLSIPGWTFSSEIFIRQFEGLAAARLFQSDGTGSPMAEQ